MKKFSLIKNNGITLISLVITIIILLILAGITITSLTGSGLFEKAIQAKKKVKEAEVKEKVELILTEYQIEKVNNKELDILYYLNNKKNNGEIEQIIEKQDGNIDIILEEYKITINRDNFNIEYILPYDSVIGVYEIIGYNQENDIIEILIKIKSDTDIKSITYPENNTEKFTNSEKEISIDYEVVDGERYEFIVETDKNREKYIIQTKGTTKGNQITSKEALEEVTKLVSLGCSYENREVKLANNIDLQCDKDNQWNPIGSETNKFKGTFDGNNKIISNIYIDSNENYQALFGWNTGIIKNIIVSNSIIKTTSQNVAGIVAYNDVTGIIENAHNKSCVVKLDNASGDSYAGGICANNSGIIRKCSNEAEISSNTKGSANAFNSTAGGIVGGTLYASAEISECYNNGDIEAKSTSRCSYTGGIIGVSFGGSIVLQNCYNTGEIVSEGVLAPGANPTTYKYSTAGGIIGYLYSTMECSYCYNTGNIVSLQYSGGILGCHDGGSLNKFENVYYLNTSSNYIIGNSANVTGKLEDEDMKTNILLENLNDKWKQISNLNNGYPILKWQKI